MSADAPDEMVEAVAQAIRERLSQDTDGDVLSVPALAEVIARDAKVREIVAEFFAPEPHRSAGKPMRANNAFHDIAALYPEAGK